MAVFFPHQGVSGVSESITRGSPSALAASSPAVRSEPLLTVWPSIPKSAGIEIKMVGVWGREHAPPTAAELLPQGPGTRPQFERVASGERTHPKVGGKGRTARVEGARDAADLLILPGVPVAAHDVKARPHKAQVALEVIGEDLIELDQHAGQDGGEIPPESQRASVNAYGARYQRPARAQRGIGPTRIAPGIPPRPRPPSQIREANSWGSGSQ